jgi:hypothetical protein
MASTTASLKLNLADLAPLMQRFPEENRSSIVRSVIFAVASLGEPLTTAPLELSPATVWTTISLDTVGELLLELAFRKGGSKNLSALIYHGLRMPSVLDKSRRFLTMTPDQRQVAARELLLHTGAFVPEAPPESVVTDDASAVLTFLLGEVSRTAKALDEATENHAKASAALEAFRRTVR